MSLVTLHAPRFTLHAPRSTHHPLSTIHHFCLVPMIRKQSPLIRKQKPLIRKLSPLIRKRKPLIRERNPLVLDDFANPQRTCENAGRKKAHLTKALVLCKLPSSRHNVRERGNGDMQPLRESRKRTDE